MMLDPANDLLPPPSSPTASSISSSDLDTESTGSFFHDRSTTLGTLMGVQFPAIAFRPPSRSHSQHRQMQPTSVNGENSGCGGGGGGAGGGLRSRRVRKKGGGRVVVVGEEERKRWRRRRWWWWRLCRDYEDFRPSSLGEYLEVERRFGDVTFLDGGSAAAELERDGDTQFRNGRMLFADGRVLPPVENDEESEAAAAGGLCRFSVVSLAGICNSGGG